MGEGVTLLINACQDVVSVLAASYRIQSGYHAGVRNRIKLLRQQKGLSQTRLAELLGTSKMQLSRLETGKRRLADDWVYRIAKVLEVHPGALWQDVPDQLDEKTETLVELFSALPDSQKDALIQLAENLAKPYRPQDAGEDKSPAPTLDKEAS